MSVPSALVAMASCDGCDCPAWLRPGGGCLPWSPYGVCQALLPERIPGQPETPPGLRHVGAGCSWKTASACRPPQEAAARLTRRLQEVGGSLRTDVG